jgi:signal transduction histidine kinase
MKRYPGFLNVSISLLPWLLVVVGLYLVSLYSYLLFHSLIELFSIIVAGGIFMVAWNARGFLDNNYLLYLGIVYFFVGLMDLLHTLAYKGMDVFAGTGSNLPTQLWTASRYLQSISYLIAPFFISRKLKAHVLLIVYAVLTVVLLTSIFYWRIFPVCYIEGVGLTTFKIVSEYLVSIFFLISIFLLLQKRSNFHPDVLKLLIYSNIAAIGSELFFTSYVSVYGGANMIGHYLRLISFYLLYKAIIETGLVKPYDLLFRNLKLKEEVLEQQTVELQVRNEELDAFAHTVAHDLQNPLAAIITASNTLQNVAITKSELDEFLGGIIETASNMSGIIDDLLLFAEVRKVEAPSKPLDMKAIVAEVKERFHLMIKNSGAQISEPEDWPAALGYGSWVEEVWANYLNNALKYGGLPPRIELGADVQPDGMIRFWVCDHGRGLTPEQQEALFKPFLRLDQIHTKGHGLGLSIVRRIVDKLGGQAGVISEVGKGSTFYFTLPEAPEQASMPSVEYSTSRQFSGGF